MATTPTITTVPGRCAGSTNVVINGYRYTKDKKRGDRTYMKCVLAREGCRARIVLVNGGLVSLVLDHPTDGVHYSATYVHVAKQKFRRNAAQKDKPTKLLVAEVVRPIRKAFKLIRKT